MNCCKKSVFAGAAIIGTFLISTNLAFASGDYAVLEGYPVGRCREASRSKTSSVRPLSPGETCSINVNFNYTGYSDGEDITPPRPYESWFTGVTFWAEYQNPKSNRWSKVSQSRKLLRNNVTKQIVIVPKKSGNYRVAFDYYGQTFADDFAKSFQVAVK